MMGLLEHSPPQRMVPSMLPDKVERVTVIDQDVWIQSFDQDPETTVEIIAGGCTSCTSTCTTSCCSCTG